MPHTTLEKRHDPGEFVPSPLKIGPVVLEKKMKILKVYNQYNNNNNSNRQQTTFNQKSSLKHLAQVS